MPRSSRADRPDADAREIVETVATWFAREGRSLPWRAKGAGAWGILVSEVMLQQTPVSRVLPAWTSWMEWWPTPAALAAASPGDVIRAWGRLGYPRRAQRLRECAVAIERDFGGVVPDTVDALRTLPGVGEYTAAAVAAFAYRRRTVVLDTNVRRVLARVAGGVADAPSHLTVAERSRADRFVPEDPELAAAWNVGAMELGALVCTSRAPRCDECPVSTWCRWLAADCPPAPAPRRVSQTWEGSDRQVRGRIMALLRASDRATNVAGHATLADVDPGQLDRCLEGLVDDGLVRVDSDERGTYAL